MTSHTSPARPNDARRVEPGGADPPRNQTAALDSETYRATRSAWERIWRDESDISRELRTLDYPRSQRIHSLYMPHLVGSKLVLEAGCGLGIELVHLDRHGYSPVGVDYVESALRQVHIVRPDFRLSAADIHRLPFPGGVFDAYLSFGVLEHFEFGPGPALREARRVLRPGGVIVMTVPYPNLVWRWRRRRRRITSRTPQYYETTYEPAELEDHLVGAGFEVVARHPVGHSYTLWGLGRAFRGEGYYETSALAERVGDWLRRWAPWVTCFASLVIAAKPSEE